MITGVCTSVCQTSIDDLVREAWVDRLIELVVHYQAGDQTARKSAHGELRAMLARASQDAQGDEIPERSWALPCRQENVLQRF